MNKQEFIDRINEERFPVLKELLVLPSDTEPKNNSIQLFAVSDANPEPDVEAMMNRICEDMSNCLMYGKRGVVHLANGEDALTMGGVLKTEVELFSYSYMDNITPFLEIKHTKDNIIMLRFSIDSPDPKRFTEQKVMGNTDKENCLCLKCKYSLVARGKRNIAAYCTAFGPQMPALYIPASHIDFTNMNDGAFPDVQECNRFEKNTKTKKK